MISKNTKIYVTISLIFLVCSIVFIFLFGLKLSPELSGRSEILVSFEQEPTKENIGVLLENEYEISQNDDLILISGEYITEDEYTNLLSKFETLGNFKIEQFQSFSPQISAELIRKSIITIIFASFLIILFIGYAFRRLIFPLSSWKYGVVSIIALIHDIIIPLGLTALFGVFTHIAVVDILFITAVLAIIGYSINDTIIIFDRVRERLLSNEIKKRKEEFGDTIDFAVKKSVRRTIFTSLTTVGTLFVLAIFVPVTRWFGWVLFTGISVGTYSSLFLAPSLIYLWNKHFKQSDTKKKSKTEIEMAEEELFDKLKDTDSI